MEMRKVLIADHSEEFAAALADALRGNCFVRVCSTGVQALEQLRSFQPDVLVMDVMLPELDGISLLQAAQEKEIMTNVLALTRSAAPYITEALDRLGVGYIMMKPCKTEAVRERVLDLASQSKPRLLGQQDIRNTVSNLLISLRIPTKLRGYGCTREAILYLMRDPEMSITKELYPAVAQICDGSAVQVERAIRGAIQAAWSNQDDEVWPKFFRPCADGTIPRPTNAAFLTRLADRLVLEQMEGMEE